MHQIALRLNLSAALIVKRGIVSQRVTSALCSGQAHPSGIAAFRSVKASSLAQADQVPVLATGARAGRLDQAACPDMLLETVALGAHEDTQSAGLESEPEDGDPAGRQQQEVSRTRGRPGTDSRLRTAHGASPGSAAGTVQRVVEGARLGKRQRPVVQGAGLRQLTDFVERANLLNRPLRTRTVGGVGAGGEKPRLPD